MPSTRQEYWVPKLRRNAERDAKNYHDLEDRGWRCFVAWECELKDIDAIADEIADLIATPA